MFYHHIHKYTMLVKLNTQLWINSDIQNYKSVHNNFHIEQVETVEFVRNRIKKELGFESSNVIITLITQNNVYMEDTKRVIDYAITDYLIVVAVFAEYNNDDSDED